ncbi:UDP-N-acetylmuramate--L-alanine ligase [Poriferisphaera sp. WC338]|uniref:UDP-N-acetylmuramate--L-alanine ligase n=1 Tax=Poriferisphaera sp. WC338 TaxID=3425129 RepID=UPI003D81BDF8
MSDLKQKVEGENRDILGVDPSGRIALSGKHLHFVGIGGCGMSGLARMCHQFGAHCSGSDLGQSKTVQELTDLGIPIADQQAEASLPETCDAMIISAAIKDDHPEVCAARKRAVPVVKYAKMLGQLMLGRTAITIAGTHGKSSTTSFLAHIMIQCDLDPSFIVGANCEQIGGGSRVCADDSPNHFLLAEACEYDRSFHNFHPTHAIILNVEADHLDMYSGLDEIVEAFSVFAKKVPESGTLLINHDMGCRLEITAGLSCPVETIGYSPEADWQVRLNKGRAHLDHNGEKVCQWRVPLPGVHMAYNAAAAAITAHRLGADWKQIAAAIESFRGLDRRMQLLGVKDYLTHRDAGDKQSDYSITVIDDYGHHPTEVETTLRALKHHYQPKRLICVFQPHQHSRTRFLMEQFATSFSDADVVIVPHIYFVRDSEAERHAVTSADLVDRLRQKNVQAMHLYPFDAIIEQLELITRPGDLLVTMGAGDVWKVARGFLGDPAP